MVIDNISDCIRSSKKYQSLIKYVDENQSINLKGTVGGFRSILMALLFKDTKKSLCFIAADEDNAEIMRDDLAHILDDDCVAFFPNQKDRPYEDVLIDTFRKGVFQESLEKIFDSNPVVLITTAKVVLKKIPSKKYFQRQKLAIKIGEVSDFEIFKSLLIDLGFTREPVVENYGEMSVHGGIIDIFPFSKEHPIRIEFFGDEIESIREFNIQTQRSIKSINELTIYPQFSEHVPLNPDDLVTIFDYLKRDAFVVVEDEMLVSKQIEESFEEACIQYQYKKDKYDLPAPDSIYLSWERIEENITQFKTISFSSQSSDNGGLIDFGIQNQPVLKGNFNLLKERLDQLHQELQLNINDKCNIKFLCESQDQIDRLTDIMDDVGIQTNQIDFIEFPLNHGFIYPAEKLIVLTDTQFYGRISRRFKVKRFSAGLSFRQLKSLSIGDYVVHIDQGIGIYRGLKKITVNGHERECLTIEYKDKDFVYVPLEKMKRVQKYSAKDGAVPHINKLGSNEWQKLKKRTKKKIKDIARDLIKLYAERRSQQGYAFSADSHWQKELEASFEYKETADQIKAIEFIKKDMERSSPMDRLVCGDVGYGKTEVAIRAAFKAVNDNKQVAILVPTTVLALQHYNTFKERLGKYPIKIEMLSRFRKRNEQKKILEWLSEGKVDIIIGTHRLLSNDVKFRELGLMIIDEEQRFGVRNKEKLKKIKVNVDVLTMTATPIPRTLNMALMGVRDLSLINTPPRGRLPISTDVVPFDKEIIRAAIMRELQRGGQIFFVHNRIESIYAVGDLLKKLVPEAKFAIAHGQMDEKNLEYVMWEFSEKKYDCLISTMIIESGLDISNVNTLIINRADRFGLSQLYQLRGRVGRSDQRAYAYLIAPPIKNMTKDAIKRLRTIEEFTELGSGFQIAMRDLQIRGAGNILGGEQSGFIVSLGFDLYTKILDEAITELKAERDGVVPVEKEKLPEPKVEINVDAYIPEYYVEQPEERVRFYKRLVEVRNMNQMKDIEHEIEDRFGKMPVEAKNLFYMIKFKILGSELMLTQIRIDASQMRLQFHDVVLNENKELLQRRLVSIVDKAKNNFTFVQNEGKSLGLKIKFPPKIKDRFNYSRNFLQSLV